MAQDDAPEIEFTQHPAGLKVTVRGVSSLQNTVAYWQAILGAVARQPVRAILLVDELQGAPLSEDQWRQLVERIRGGALDQVRIAHVKPFGLQTVEFCQLFALEAGINARVFASEIEADLWLRHGVN